MTTYEFDTGLDPNFPVLTRGNAGEIMPGIVSPLSATMFFPPLERGWRRSFTELWDVMEWPTYPTTFAPIVGGRFYINISAFRRLADLTPGTSPDDIDRTLFAAGGIKLDPYEVPDEPGYAERGQRIAAATAEFLEHPPIERVAGEHDQAQARRRDGRAHRQSRSSAELLDRIISLIPYNESDFVTLFIGSSVSPVVLGSLQAGLVAVYGDEGYELGRRAVMGGGGIESADAGKAVASLASLDDAEFEAAFERVLEQYGFRGVNEWEVASPSWEIEPEMLRRAIDAVRSAGAPRDPGSIREAVLERFEDDGTRTTFPELDLWLERCRVWMGIRERTKATCVLTINEQRLDALEIGRRLVAEGKLESADQIYFLTLEELTTAVSRAPSTSTSCTRERPRNTSWSGTRNRCSPSSVRSRQSRSGPWSAATPPSPAPSAKSSAPPGAPATPLGALGSCATPTPMSPRSPARCSWPRSPTRAGCRCSSARSRSWPRWAAS